MDPRFTARCRSLTMNRISTRFALLMAAAAVVPLLAYGAVSILSVRNGAQRAIVAGNQDVARRVGEQIELYITSNVRILSALAAEMNQTGLVRWQQDRILKNYVLQFPEFAELTLVDDGGRPMVTSRLGQPTTDIPGSDSISVGGALISRFSVDDDLLPTGVVAVRLQQYDGGGGWLIGRLRLEELWLMVDTIRQGSEGYALVVTNDGRLIAHGNPSAKSKVARGDNLNTHSLIVRVRDAELSPARVASQQYFVDGREMLGVAAQVSTLGWTVLVEQPVSEAFEIPISLQRQLFVAIAVALLVMLTLGYVWG